MLFIYNNIDFFFFLNVFKLKGFLVIFVRLLSFILGLVILVIQLRFFFHNKILVFYLNFMRIKFSNLKEILNTVNQTALPLRTDVCVGTQYIFIQPHIHLE